MGKKSFKIISIIILNDDMITYLIKNVFNTIKDSNFVIFVVEKIAHTFDGICFNDEPKFICTNINIFTKNIIKKN